MIYGDGRRFIPLSGSLYVLAHELTHAVTEYYADLRYSVYANLYIWEIILILKFQLQVTKHSSKKKIKIALSVERDCNKSKIG